MTVVERKVVVQLKTGLQARPAALFVQEANRFASDVFIEKEGRKVNAKSIMGVMSLAIGTGTEVTLSADGSDADQVVSSLSVYVSKEA